MANSQGARYFLQLLQAGFSRAFFLGGILGQTRVNRARKMISETGGQTERKRIKNVTCTSSGFWNSNRVSYPHHTPALRATAMLVASPKKQADSGLPFVLIS